MSHASSAGIRFGSIFGYIRYVFGALSVVAFGLSTN